MQHVPIDTLLTTEQVAKVIGRATSTTRNMLTQGEIRSVLLPGRGRGSRQVALIDLLEYCREMEITPDLSSLSLADFPQAVQETPVASPPPPPPAVPSRIVVMPSSQLTEQLARTGSFFEEEGEDDEQEDYDEQDDGYEEAFTPTWSQEHEFMFIERLNIVLCKFCPLAYHFEKETNSGTPLWVMVRVPIR